MEHPVREIPAIITTLTTGSPAQQSSILHEYFLPSASFAHPFCHVPSFGPNTIPFLPQANSLWVLLQIYRWYRTLSPSIDITIDSAVFDQRSSQLHVTIHQTFRLWFVPLYAARVRLVTVLDLEQRTAWAADETVSEHVVTGAPDEGPGRVKYFIRRQEDLYQLTDCLEFVAPRLGPLLWRGWQLFSTVLCVLGALVLLPLYYLLNRDKTAKKLS